MKGLRRIITDLAFRKIKVSDIETKVERQKYLDGFRKAEQPDREKAGSEVVPLRKAPDSITQAKKKEKRARLTPASYERNALIPRDVILQLEPGKLNDIFHELRRLSPKSHPNACGVLLRVFLELGVDQYLDDAARRSEVGAHEDAKLADKVQKVANHLKTQGVLSDDDLRPIRRAVSSDQLLAASIPTLHAYVHSIKVNPDPDSLKKAWDSLELFLQEILPTQ